jgi:hypothetical protein
MADTLKGVAQTLKDMLDYMMGIRKEAEGAAEASGNIGSGTEGGGTCFAAGTLILMTDKSLRPIESVKIGDRVWSYDFHQSAFVRTKVKKIFKHRADETSGYYVINESLRVTGEHLLYCDGTWTPARQVKVGYCLKGTDLRPQEIQSLRWVDDAVETYNLHTSHPSHNYFASGYLVHNAKGGTEEGGGGGGGGTLNASLSMPSTGYAMGGVAMQPQMARLAEFGPERVTRLSTAMAAGAGPGAPSVNLTIYAMDSADVTQFAKNKLGPALKKLMQYGYFKLE